MLNFAHPHSSRLIASTASARVGTEVLRRNPPGRGHDRGGNVSVRRHMARLGREPVLGDVSELKFATRPAANAARPRASRPYIALSILAAMTFAGVVIAMLDRSAGTAGRSPVPSTTPTQSPESLGQHFAQPAVPSVDTSFDAPPAQDWRQPDRFVYQCIGASGAKEYQSDPCGATQREVRVYAATPDTKREMELARMLQQRR